MIIIRDKKDCCGCGACVQICPKQCITMVADEEGFKYPQVDDEACIECGLCEKTCPVINQAEPRKPFKVYAAKHSDEEIRLKSSSGGVFTLLAESIIQEGGVVFGVRFDSDWKAVHDFTESVEGLESFRGSKYVQSDIRDNFKKAKEFLKNGRKVLFSGTPCQIAGLKKFLRKDYDNLLTVDVVCHGVPSPSVWLAYINSIARVSVRGKNTVLQSLKDSRRISDVSFRDKRTGWQKYGFAAYSSDQREDENSVLQPKKCLAHYSTVMSNIYMRGFLQNLYLRPSCYCCRFRCFHSCSDITIADLWGVERIAPLYDDDKGASLIMDKSGRFKLSDTLSCLELNQEQITHAYKCNRSIFEDEVRSASADAFWREFLINPDCVQKSIRKHTTISRKTMIRNGIDDVLIKLNLYIPAQQLVRKMKYGK